MKKVIGVTFSNSKKIYYFDIHKLTPEKGDNLIVETERGLQFCNAVTNVIEIDEKKLNSDLKKVVRKATKADYNKNKENEELAKQAFEDAKKIVSELDLDMKILEANFTLDRKQLMFNFMADERIDFRELARRLAAIYKTRIELRQIGVRDKACIVGGYGQCGKELCCGAFLKDINSVSINMAKNQNLALNPQKINGVCGRLMCCLSYENEDYNEYKKGLPKVGDKVEYNGEKGKVIYVDLFSRIYKIELEDSKVVEVNEKGD